MPDVDRMPILPAHIYETVQAIARLHDQHDRQATPLQKIIEAITARAGRPSSIGLLTVIVVGWMGLNLILKTAGYQPVDEPPFYWMQGATGLAALYMTVLILATQRREDQLASHREQLTLELAIVSEQKTAKIIELIEELRRDSPDILNRIDHEAVAMAAPADPQAVLEAIKDTHEDLRSPKVKDEAEPAVQP